MLTYLGLKFQLNIFKHSLDMANFLSCTLQTNFYGNVLNSVND